MKAIGVLAISVVVAMGAGFGWEIGTRLARYAVPPLTQQVRVQLHTAPAVQPVDDAGVEL